MRAALGGMGRSSIAARGELRAQVAHIIDVMATAIDLAAEQPAVRVRLVAAWERWAERCHVVPWPRSQPYVPAGKGR